MHNKTAIVVHRLIAKSCTDLIPGISEIVCVMNLTRCRTTLALRKVVRNGSPHIAMGGEPRMTRGPIPLHFNRTITGTWVVSCFEFSQRNNRQTLAGQSSALSARGTLINTGDLL